MLELLIVILIFWLILWATKSMFNLEQRDFIKSQTCVNNVYWEIKNFFDDASTGKWIYSWDVLNWWTVFPDVYGLEVDKVNQRIFLIYSWVDIGTTTWTYLTIWFSGAKETWISPFSCYDNGYDVSISTWTIDSLLVKKQFEWDINNTPFLINQDLTAFTWDIYFYYCHQSQNCRAIWKILFDKRVYQTRFSRCLQWYELGECTKWSN